MSRDAQVPRAQDAQERPLRDTRSSLDIAGWIVLAIGAVRLALPQRDVRQIELAADLKDSAAGEGREIGWFIRKNGPSWPAYSLDESLRLERPPSAGRKLCVFMGETANGPSLARGPRLDPIGEQEDAVRGVLCNRVWSLAADTDLGIEAVPGCMTGMRSLATGLSQFEGTAALVTDRAALAAYLDFLLEPEHGEHG
jgi:hypothetical protein